MKENKSIREISILCVSKNSIYKNMQNLDLYDIERDCYSFSGNNSVVAHPPCRSWSAFCSHQAKPAPGEKEIAPWCVERVVQNGGILEHPAHSRLWDELSLPLPGSPYYGGLWSLEIHQYWFGYENRKKTWLLINGISPAAIPSIPYRLHPGTGDRKRWQNMTNHQRLRTPLLFAEWLVEVARLASMEVSLCS